VDVLLNLILVNKKDLPIEKNYLATIGTKRGVELSKELMQLLFNSLNEKYMEVLPFIVFVLFASSDLLQSFMSFINKDTSLVPKVLNLVVRMPEVQRMQVMIYRQSKKKDENMYVSDILDNLYVHYCNHIGNNQEICKEMTEALMLKVPEVVSEHKYIEWVNNVAIKYLISTPINTANVWEWKKQCKMRKTGGDNTKLINSFTTLMNAFKKSGVNGKQMHYVSVLVYLYSSGWRNSTELLLIIADNPTLFKSAIITLFNSNTYFPKLFLKTLITSKDVNKNPEVFLKILHYSIEALTNNKCYKWLLNASSKIFSIILSQIKDSSSNKSMGTIIPNYEIACHYFPKVGHHLVHLYNQKNILEHMVNLLNLCRC